jgi:nicotinate-nucleotide pyrophosphorylase (carboxylating)
LIASDFREFSALTRGDAAIMKNLFTPAEVTECRRLVAMAFQEDLGDCIAPNADITSASFVDPRVEGNAAMVARQSGILAGVPAAALVFSHLDRRVRFTALIEDGTLLVPGDRIATIAGPGASVLTAERTALNFVQYLSGIATLTNEYVQTVAGLPVKIVDTRKTIPGWRLLSKYAVRQGGGHNHRMGLYDMVLIKDNHWSALSTPGALEKSLAIFRADHPGVPIEIEVETLGRLDQALAAKPDIVLLDNMPLDMMREAVKRRNAVAAGVLLEASGGVNLQTVRAIAETGVDRISVGALTHSAPALDIALDYKS